MPVRAPRKRRPRPKPVRRPTRRTRFLAPWNRHRDTLDNLLEGFQVIAPDWSYLYVNPAAARHGRKTPEELIGHCLTDVYPGIEDTDVFRAMATCMRERTAESFETLFTFPDGMRHWFDVRIQPVPEGLCVHSIDIHERKQAEGALREQEHIARLGQLAAVVAHEVKNPLAGLSGALQILKRRRPSGDPEVAIYDEMLACIHSLDRLVRDLLIFAKPVRLDATPISIVDVIHDARGVLGEGTGHAHEVVVSGSAALPLHGDPELLKNVFRNLLLNAAEAMREPGTIAIDVDADDTMCRVTVTDSGPGIPPALASRVFEPFVSGKKGGTGLGLPISRRIMRLHGGDLQLVPRTAPGAAFLLTLPLR